MPKPNPMGSTFAERKAAREGSEFKAPAPVDTGNTTFAERAGKPAKKAASKAVKSDDDAVEDKAVKSSETKASKKS